MIYIVLSVLGLCLGSFVNALAWRIYEQSKTNKKRPELSILRGRSMCPHCQHVLSVQDLVPVLSWVSLKGKCRYCKHPISSQYPIVEAATALSFVFSYYYWIPEFDAAGTITFALWLIILTLLIALFVYDLKWMILPDRLVFPLIATTAVFAFINILNTGESLGHGIKLALICMVITAGLFEGLFLVSSGKWIGGGDAKLGLALGLILLRPDNAILMMFLASLLGSLAALPSYLKHGRKNARIPFGPFLILASFIVFFFGQSIINWYLSALNFS